MLSRRNHRDQEELGWPRSEMSKVSDALVVVVCLRVANRLQSRLHMQPHSSRDIKTSQKTYKFAVGVHLVETRLKLTTESSESRRVGAVGVGVVQRVSAVVVRLACLCCSVGMIYAIGAKRLLGLSTADIVLFLRGRHDEMLSSPIYGIQIE